MPNLTPTSSFDDVPELETATLALGGPGGPMNLPAQALLNRTQWLKDNAVAGSAGPYAAGAGTANAITASFTPPITSLSDGLKLRILAAATNTGAATFAPNALTAQPILGGAYAALQGGEILADGEVELTWNAALTSWVITAQAGGSPQVPDATKSKQAASKGQVDQVYSDLAGTATGKGSALLGAKRADVANAVASTVATWLNNEVIVPTRDFGFDNTGTSANDTALATLLASIQLNVDGRGRRIRFMSGKYRFDSTMAFTQYAAGLVQNIILEGDGAANTVFDFGSAPAGSDGITFDSGTHVTIRDIAVNYAPRDGIVLGAGLTTGGGAYLSMVTIERVRVQSAGRHALNMTNTYLCSVRDSWFKDMASNGINVVGFSTSLQLDRCECSGSTGGVGYALNGVIYSTLNSCGSDSNNQQGYALSNCQGVVLNGCGAEANGKDSYLLTTSTASTTGIPSSAQDIRGVVFNGCYGLSGSQLAPGNYATFIGASTHDGRSIEFKINGGAAHGATASDRALILAGVSGQVTCHKDLFYDADCVAADSYTGSYEITNETVRGRVAMAVMSGNQAIASGAQTTVSMASLSKNSMGATLSSNAIVIPRGVNRVRVTASVNWAASATGSRYMEVDKNSGTFSGMPIMRVPGVASLQPVSMQSGVIDVVAGDTFLLSVVQDSGANLNINGPNNSSFLMVEAIG